ncbi:DEAD/DEAH box helicase [Nonlabens ulvanivorans]|uniref:ATP-dependent RNA helicase RhlE n=2 Tax=Nonlabens ulvanivorans TaxID=906888 RepID=A0A084JZ70_NONUL|nr:DEAD/DEAH box helicase [Nonlabens ulvanivorans]KEZ94254.1 DEAD/DEAH box helicase [Nonlabens ulvanivorans]PRX13247.1 ATP-dependent RNA helicase RhlE [Nonlabens ulvanivorans]WOI21658.1 DEAD/DEAH box helicase [Nonlabens ulvanivorans]
MKNFEELNLGTPLRNGINDLGFTTMTPIQEQAFPVILSGRDMIGIAQTGTGKTLGYMLPLLHELKYADTLDPRMLILVPTRELVVQVVEQIEAYAAYINVRVLGVYGGTNINTQKKAVTDGVDIIVATPGRLYDLIVAQTVRLKNCKKVVIDEVDVMLDLGFRFQLTNIFDHLPVKRQNIMFSATMTDQIEDFIKSYFFNPEKVSVAVSGTRLENIEQTCYPVENFYTKANLLMDLLTDEEEFRKVLVFAGNKKSADRLQEYMLERYGDEIAVIHSNKTQNYRLRSIELFDTGERRILIATDVMARGLDLDKISHVINIDVPSFPENYMHRIGRSGRAEEKGKTILFYTEKEREDKEAIEALMDYKIPEIPFPEEVEISTQKTPEEKPVVREIFNPHKIIEEERGASFHEKSEKNKKVNLGGSYRREIAKKYKKPKTRGDKIANRRRKK